MFVFLHISLYIISQSLLGPPLFSLFGQRSTSSNDLSEPQFVDNNLLLSFLVVSAQLNYMCSCLYLVEYYQCIITHLYYILWHNFDMPVDKNMFARCVCYMIV